MLGQIIGQGLAVYSLKKTSSSLVALFMLVMPIFSHIEARFIFSEPTNLVDHGGYLIILLGMYLEITVKG